MSTLYLIDGNSYFYRAFYAIRRLSTSKGFPTNAIYGFTNMLLKIMREKEPDYFGIVFDSPEPTERHRIYEEYKAHRPSMPDDLRQQIPVIKEIIRAFHIAIVEIAGYEADDLLATMADRAKREGLDVFIVTGDKDLCQVVDSSVRLYDSMKERITGEEEVIARFGVRPDRVPEILALMGDSSDNIPGVPGIGEKTAVKLLKEFSSLDSLIQNRSSVKNRRIREALSENIENIKMSHRLATIDRNAPVDISLNDLRPGSPAWSELREFFRIYEFHTLLRMIPEEEHPKNDSTEYITVLDGKTLAEAVSETEEELALDTETTSRSPITADLVGISLSSDPERAYYIPVAHSYEGAPPQLKKSYVLKHLKGILENPAIRKTGHNIKYDLIVLKKEGIGLRGIDFDTILASYLLNPNRTNHSLEDVTMDYLSQKKMSFREVIGKGRRDFSEVPVESASRYSGEDSAVTLLLRKRLEPELEKEGLSGLFRDLEMPLIDVLADMETEGIKIDLSLMRSLSEKLGSEMESLEKRIYFIAGDEFNINSPKQLQEILFEKLGLRTIKKTKTGFSTAVDVLEQLSYEHELPGEILEYRMLSKLRNTYVEALPKIVNPATGRLHTSFNQTITATGRLSSSEPNLQNIPVRGSWGRRIREAFVAEGSNVLISSDYSQIELRVLAHLSGDRGLIEVFLGDGDIHTRTASELFGLSPDRVDAEMRRRAKTVNFGIVYGISPFGLSRQLGITAKEAKHYIDTYFERHGGVRTYFDSQIKDATDKGYVCTVLNRKRAIPELRSRNRNTRQLGERMAMNTPIQGSAADIIKVSMLNIWKRLSKEGFKARMLLQVHDELLFESPQGEKSALQALVKEEMENALKICVPLKVDIGSGRNWAEAH
jgi:DNA polymerase-1